MQPIKFGMLNKMVFCMLGSVRITELGSYPPAVNVLIVFVPKIDHIFITF